MDLVFFENFLNSILSSIFGFLQHMHKQVIMSSHLRIYLFKYLWLFYYNNSNWWIFASIVTEVQKSSENCCSDIGSGNLYENEGSIRGGTQNKSEWPAMPGACKVRISSTKRVEHSSLPFWCHRPDVFCLSVGIFMLVLFSFSSSFFR